MKASTKVQVLVAILAATLFVACGPTESEQPPPVEAKDALTVDYLDDLSAHPGCSIEAPDAAVAFFRSATEWYTPATIPGYQCAAKEYEFPAGVVEDTTKPIALLIHGNSDTPMGWETCMDGTVHTTICNHANPMVAETLAAQGLKTYAVDMRFDRVCQPVGPDKCDKDNNAGANMSHGWSVPIVQHFIKSLMAAHPDRKFVIIAHSFGVTTARDALRRLQVNDQFNPWPQLVQFIGAAGGSHGVSTFDLGYCDKYKDNMRGQVVCEMGSRSAFQPTDFLRPLNGTEGKWEVPCLDDSAYGVPGKCQGNQPSYHTLVIEDIDNTHFVDEFVSQSAARLAGADNSTIGTGDIDTSGYFYKDFSTDKQYGLFKGHFGAMRSEAALNKIDGWVGTSD